MTKFEEGSGTGDGSESNPESILVWAGDRYAVEYIVNFIGWNVHGVSLSQMQAAESAWYAVYRYFAWSLSVKYPG